MPKSMFTLLSAAVAAAAVGLSACGSSSYGGSSTAATKAAATAPSASAVAVHTTSIPTAGTILVDSSGMTLYHLTGERAGKFICNSTECLSVWHPLAIAAGAKPSGNAALGVVKRPDGSTQVTYAGAPLYTFASDTHPGQTTGQGVKDVGTWTVVKVGAGAAGNEASGGGSPTTRESSTSESGSAGSTSESGGAYKY